MDYKALIENGQELHHYGVKGMKRGVHKAGSYGKNLAVNAYNTVRHPVYHNKAVLGGASHSILGAQMQTHTNLKYKNAVVKKLVDSKRKMNKKDRYSIKNRLSKKYRLGESKRVEAAIRSTPYRA